MELTHIICTKFNNNLLKYVQSFRPGQHLQNHLKFTHQLNKTINLLASYTVLSVCCVSVSMLTCISLLWIIGPSEVRAPEVGVAHAGGERSVHY